jgi:hypothetical protein
MENGRTMSTKSTTRTTPLQLAGDGLVESPIADTRMSMRDAPPAGSEKACSRVLRDTSGAAAPDAKAYTYSPPHVETVSDALPLGVRCGDPVVLKTE